MRRVWHRRATVSAALLIAVATAVAWVASVVAFPHGRDPLPGAGPGDRSIICLIDGRLLVFRRVATITGGARMIAERHPYVADPNKEPPPSPEVWVDLREANAVTIVDYTVRPPRFAPESYRSVATERDYLSAHPWGWFGVDLGRPRAARTFTISGGKVSVTQQLWAVPFWPLLLAPAFYLSRLLWRNRRSERWSRAGRCATCGYDLRATPGRCPECGADPRPSAT